jgi:hypothetical protein
MTNYDVKRLALVYAKQAEIEGMKAENRALKFEGTQVQFRKSDFEQKVMEMESIAYMHDEQL